MVPCCQESTLIRGKLKCATLPSPLTTNRSTTPASSTTALRTHPFLSVFLTLGAAHFENRLSCAPTLQRPTCPFEVQQKHWYKHELRQRSIIQ
mmetsp:Transcript_23259/g.64864  ORF Transcript_23259/g.64864 Transcript_23259/m.64864 type:complete len:93 (-) Transcript_23259:804-1082(-)